MKSFIRSIAVCAALFACFSISASAQDDELKKREKEFYESIDKEVERLSNLLDLDDWQMFYVDSILTHDYKALNEELTALRKQKVSNTDMYYEIQYKWLDKIYYAYEKIFNEEQWAKYLKSGAGRDKKSREKKQAKSK